MYVRKYQDHTMSNNRIDKSGKYGYQDVFNGNRPGSGIVLGRLRKDAIVDYKDWTGSYG